MRFYARQSRLKLRIVADDRCIDHPNVQYIKNPADFDDKLEEPRRAVKL